jgi:hypothetical protein
MDEPESSQDQAYALHKPRSYSGLAPPPPPKRVSHECELAVFSTAPYANHYLTAPSAPPPPPPSPLVCKVTYLTTKGGEIRKGWQ